jgi:peptidoglycan/LPS O-acetylase OafA/YrhL
MGLFRFILALSVFIAHAQPVLGIYLIPGNVAVEAFFIISGFYMSLILNEKYLLVKGGYKIFIKNRLLRIFPIYWIVLIFSIAASAFIYKSGGYGAYSFYDAYFKELNPFSALYVVLVNTLLVGQDVLLFLKLNYNGSLSFTTVPFSEKVKLYNFLFIQPAWTLSLELFFYFIAPIVIKSKSVFVVVLLLLVFAMRFYTWKHGLSYDPWLYRFFPFELMWFLMGTLSYSLYANALRLKPNKIYGHIALVVLMLFTAVYHYLGTRQLISYAYLLTVSVSLPFIFIAFKESKIDRYIGELSYPFYLSHWQIVELSRFEMVKYNLSHGLMVVISFLLTIVVSCVLVNTVGRKIESIRIFRFKQFAVKS